MGAKNTMSSFFKAMQGQSVSPSGYGPKLVSTPMGLFGWNETLQTWVNTNNGMQMNNIAFQDMYAMMDYSTSSGDNGTAISPIIPDITPTLSPSDWGTFGSGSWSSGVTGEALFASPLAKTPNYINPAFATNVTFSSINQPILIELAAVQLTGTPPSIVYWKNYPSPGGIIAYYTTPISISNGDKLMIFIESNIVGQSCDGNIQVTNVTNGGSVVLDSIPYSVTGAVPPP